MHHRPGHHLPPRPDGAGAGRSGTPRRLSPDLTYEDVERTKPDPEIYQRLCRELEVRPEECLALEDSPSGVRAGLAAEIRVVGVATPFTRERLEEAKLLPPERVAWEPAEVARWPGGGARVVPVGDGGTAPA